jgi:hypothetical protein
MKLKLSDLKPNPINDAIYSSSDLTDLQNSLKYNGQLEPIVLNKKNVIISGHRRYYSMKFLGWEECDVRITEYKNDILALIQHNQHRVKSVQDILNESKWLEKEYKKTIGQGKRNDIHNEKKKHKTIVEIANKIGIGATKLKQIKSINNYEPELLNDIDSGKLSINKAYDLVREKYISNGEQKSDKDVFQSKFSKLLDDYKPSMKDIDDVLKKKHPYNFQRIKGVGTDHKLDDKREEFIEHMDFLKSMNVNQELLYKKQKEIQSHKFNPKLLRECQDRLWMSSNLSDKETTISEIEQLEPVLEIIDKGDNERFNILRINIHSMSYDVNPGRHLKVIVKDKSSGKYLGVITLGSDFTTLARRDEYIGWSKENKYDHHKLNNTSVANSIVPVQPFGYNFLGGKLIACLTTLPTIRNEWKKRYGDLLVGNTTTSLFGHFSIYNSIPIWKKLGLSKGSVLLKPDDEQFQFWTSIMKEHYVDEYKDAQQKGKGIGIKTSPKQSTLRLIYNKLGIREKDYQNEFNRGVYFSLMYKNGKEFLRNEIDEQDLVADERCEYDWIMNWWKEKAIRRYLKLHSENNISVNSYWFDNMTKEDVNQYLSSGGVSIS